MSELTPCCYCVLQGFIRKYGAENVRTKESDSKMIPINVEIRRNGEWKRIAGFGALTDHCAC